MSESVHEELPSYRSVILLKNGHEIVRHIHESVAFDDSMPLEMLCHPYPLEDVAQCDYLEEGWLSGVRPKILVDKL